ncbi:MAG: hypothetical protein ACKPBG_02060 [Actinomycetota bacterium]
MTTTEPWQLRNPVALGIVHLVATWFMVGLIWTVHVVHYPLFAYVGPDEYVVFQAEHVRRIGMVLVVPWAVEGICILALLVLAMRSKSRALLLPALLGAAAMGVVLIMSGLFSAPAHGELADGFDADVHADLMRADLIRTIAWTMRGGISIWMLVVLMSVYRRDISNTTI